MSKGKSNRKLITSAVILGLFLSILIPVLSSMADPSVFRYDEKRTGMSGLESDITDPVARWYFNTSAPAGSMPMAGDINNDGEMEIVWGSHDGTVYALDKDGNEIWTFQSDGPFYAPPAIGDVDGDGLNEVLAGGYWHGGSGDPNLYALNGEDGSLIWEFTTLGRGSPFEKGFEASAALYDQDGDGALDVYIGSRNHIYYALNGLDGSIMWESQFNHFIRSTSPIGDVDNDDRDELMAVDNHAIIRLFEMDGTLDWERDIGHGVSATPIFADLTGDGYDEIIFFTVGGLGHPGAPMVYDHQGNQLWTNEMYQGFYSSPTLFDVDGDGLFDILNVDSNDQVLIAYKGTDGTILYTAEPFEKNWLGPGLVSADIDGDGEIEILVCANPDLYAINAKDGSVDWVYDTNDKKVSGPKVVDLDGDGLAEIVIKVEGNLICLENGFDPFALLDKIIEYILGLDDDCFKNNADNRKKSLVNKLESVRTMMLNGDYEGAYNKLLKDVRGKMDGDGQDWITCENAQNDLKDMIDQLLAWLEKQF